MLQTFVDVLGFKVKDKVTGFIGTAACVGFDLYGCIQVVVTPPVNEKGEQGESRWFDFHRLSRMSSERVMDLPNFTGEPAHTRAVSTAYVQGPAEKPAR